MSVTNVNAYRVWLQSLKKGHSVTACRYWGGKYYYFETTVTRTTKTSLWCFEGEKRFSSISGDEVGGGGRGLSLCRQDGDYEKAVKSMGEA